MDKKYQIFVSSTYEDLKEERDQAIKAILEMGHIPVGMEMFSAADDEQWKIIQRTIDEVDYYVVVVANKYGSVTPEGISYTEKEYDYAISKGVPVLGFVLSEGAPWPTEKGEKEAKKRRSLVDFKDKVKSKQVSIWDNKNDLHGKVSISLMKAMTANPRQGWVKADGNIGPEVTKELLRLSSENSKLRGELESLEKAVSDKHDEAREVVNIMAKTKRRYYLRKTESWDSAETYERTLLDIFEIIAPNLLSENTNTNIASDIAFHLSHANDFHPLFPIPANAIANLIADLTALDLLGQSKRKHSVNDKEDYWSLTVLGKQVMKRSRRIRLEEGITADSQDDGDQENQQS